MRKDIWWLVGLLVVVGLGLRSGHAGHVDEFPSGFEWAQRFKGGDRWTFSIESWADGASLRGILDGPGREKTSTRRLSGEEFRNLMTGLAKKNVWSLSGTAWSKDPAWFVQFRVESPSRSHEAYFSSDAATPEYLALARYIDMECPVTSDQLRELSRGEHALVDTLLTYLNDVINSKMAPPP